MWLEDFNIRGVQWSYSKKNHRYGFVLRRPDELCTDTPFASQQCSVFPQPFTGDHIIWFERDSKQNSRLRTQEEDAAYFIRHEDIKKEDHTLFGSAAPILTFRFPQQSVAVPRLPGPHLISHIKTPVAESQHYIKMV